MAKRGQVECSLTKVYKRRDKKGASIDRISSLPDELLVLILSSLSLKEAVATSILSSRWRYLWTFITKLDFDGISSMVKMAFGHRRLAVDYEPERLNYVEWVNHVIALHKSPNIEEFRVVFDLTKSYKSSIDEWVRFALTKKVERLELNLTDGAFRIDHLHTDCYTLDPYNLFWDDKGSFSDSIVHVKCLKKIILSHVNVNGAALEFLLCNCPLLEHISISKSTDLTTLRIIGPLPSFKRLELESNYNLELVEIRDVNLVYLKNVGPSPRVHFVVENLPLLVEMYIVGLESDIGNVLLSFSNYIPQLEILTLLILWGSKCLTIQDVCTTVKMSNLKQLIIIAWIQDDDFLIPLINLVQASPCLQRFVFEEAKRHLRFTGTREWLMHLLDNAVALEQTY